MEPEQRVLGGHLGRPRGQGRVRHVDDPQLVLQALEVGEAQPVLHPLGLDALGPEPVLPKRQGLRRSDAVDDPVHHPGARSPPARVRVLEEREVGPRGAVLVRVEEVVDGRVVLVDGLLDHPQAQQPHVEVDVPRSVTRDGGDVVDAFELHRAHTRSSASSAVWTPSAPTSRCVTARTRRPPTAPMSTPRSFKPAHSRSGSSCSKMTMLVSTSSGSIVTPGKPASPSANPRASAWSSASRSTWWSSAYSAPAATIPAWRIAPPSICL